MRISRDSTTWRVVADAIQSRLSELRDQLEKPTLDSTGTTLARGEVKALKELLDLPDRVTQVAQSDPGYGVGVLDSADD